MGRHHPLTTTRLDREVAATEYADGLLEVVVGLLLLAFGALWIGSPGMLPIVAALAILFGPATVTRIKRRLTYPRIGYADYRADNTIDGGGVLGLVLVGVAAVVLVVAVTGDVTDVGSWRKWTGLLAGILTSGGFVAAYRRSGMSRYRAVAATSVLFGLVTSLLADGRDFSAVGWYFLTMGLTLSIVGVVEVIDFVRGHPVVAP